MDESSNCERKSNKKDGEGMVLMTNKTDRISQLPNHIVHHIFTFLPEKDVTRSSVLSKTWHQFWTLFPISDFDFSEYSFVNGLEPNTRKDRDLQFVRYVHDSVLRQHRLKTSIQRFRLAMSSDLKHEVTSLINDSLQMVIDCGVKELNLSFLENYSLPPAIFSAEALIVLKLARCNLTLACPSINWPLLREFSLYISSVDEQIIQNLSLTCPLLEKFSIIHCSGFNMVGLSGLRKLRKVKIKLDKHSKNRVKKIEIDVPNLQILNYRGVQIPNDLDCQIGVAACRNLQVLKLKSPTITGRKCQDIISKLHDLKILVLRCPLLEEIRISNKLLEKLQISSDALPRATIHTPRLESFKYNFNAIRFPFLVNITSLRKVSIKFCSDVDLYSFCQLRDHLINFNQIKILTLHISSYSIRYNMPDRYNHVPIPDLPDVKHLKLKVSSSMLLWFNDFGALVRNYKHLVDCLLWMCHPQSLLLMSGWRNNNEFMKVLCEKLMLRKRKQHCCTSSHFKCWQHDLKGVQIEHHKGNGVKEDLTCADLLASLESIALREKVFFIFQW